MRVLIIDDEIEAREGIAELLKQDVEVEVLGMCKNGLEAIKLIVALKPDLIFLDIQMPQINGFEVISSLEKEQIPAVVFVTAYDQYALKAFEIHALDYLLKPFSNERFFQCLNHVKNNISKKRKNINIEYLLKDYQQDLKTEIGNLLQTQNSSNKKRLLIKSKGRIHFVSHSDIVWIEAYDYYVKVHVKEQFYLVRESMKSMLSRLPADDFVRIHKSSIINLAYVKELEPYFNGEYIVHLTTGIQLKLSRKYRENLVEI